MTGVLIIMVLVPVHVPYVNMNGILLILTNNIDKKGGKNSVSSACDCKFSVFVWLIKLLIIMER